GPGTYRPRTVPGGLPNESPVDTHDSTAPASSDACGCRGSGYSAGEFGKLRPHHLGEFLDGLARVLPRGPGPPGDHLPMARGPPARTASPPSRVAGLMSGRATPTTARHPQAAMPAGAVVRDIQPGNLGSCGHTTSASSSTAWQGSSHVAMANRVTTSRWFGFSSENGMCGVATWHMYPSTDICVGRPAISPEKPDRSAVNATSKVNSAVAPVLSPDETSQVQP